MDNAYRKAEERVGRLKVFSLHLLAYVIVNVGLFFVNILESPGNLWFYWVVVGWGIGIMLEFVMVYSASPFGNEWEEKKMRQTMVREEKQRGGVC